MADPTLIVAAAGPLTAAIFVIYQSLRNRNNNKVVNPHDPDDTPVGQVSVGYLIKEIKAAFKDAVQEVKDEPQ